MNAQDFLNRMVASNIIVEPKLLWDLLYIYQEGALDQQLSILDSLLDICQRSIHNPLLLLNKTSQSTPDNTKLSILNLLVDLTLSSSISDRLFDLISYLVYSCDIKKTNLLHLLRSLPASSSQQLLLILRFFQLFLISPKMPAPYSYFYFNSAGSGLVLSPMTYPFSKAISMCAWIRLESASGISRLFTFHSKGIGGLEAYIVDTLLYYRTLGYEYHKPVKGSNGILLAKLPVQQWVCVAFEHQKTVLSRNQLKVVVDGIEVLTSMMDFPKINVVETTTAGIGLDLFGQISCIMFFNEVLTMEKMKSLFLHYNYGPHNNESLASVERFIIGNISKHLVMVFHPERTHGNCAYSAIGSGVARFQGLTGSKSFTLRKNTSFGGIMMLLPILSRIIQIESVDLMEEWFRLVMMCLKDRPDNQNEAVNAGFFKVLSITLEKVPSHMVTEEILNIIDDMKNSGNNRLPEQVFVHLIWNLRLWSKAEAGTLSKLFVILKAMHSKNKVLVKVVGIDYILDNFQYLDTEESVCALVEVIDIILRGSQDPGYLESFVKFLCCRSSAQVQIQVLVEIKALISENTPSGLSFSKQILEFKGFEIISWMLTSENPRIKYLCADILEKFCGLSKIPCLYSVQDFYPYVANNFLLKHSRFSTEDIDFVPQPFSISDSLLEMPESAHRRQRKSLTQSLSQSHRGSFSNAQARHEELIYHTSLELLLGRTIESNSILDDTDYIQSILGLSVLQTVVSKSLPEIMHKALQDQLMLTKFNKMNCFTLISSAEWQFWLIDLIAQTSHEIEAADAIIDIGIRLHTTVILQGMETEEGMVYMRRLLTWLEINKKAGNSRDLVRKLLEMFMLSALKVQEYSEGFWRNLISLGYLVEEFVVYCAGTETGEENLVRSRGWDDYLMCSSYVSLMRPIWSQSSEILTSEEFTHQIQEISPGRLKNEALILSLQGEANYKKRGKFGVILFHIVCMGIRATEDSLNLEFWLSTLENLVKTVLFIGESNKKTLVRQESKLYSLCISYAIGFLSAEIPKHDSRLLLQHTLAKLIKYTFTTFSLNSSKSQATGLKTILKLSLTQYNYPCDYIVAFILQHNSGIEAWDTMILHFNLRETQALLFQGDIQNALTNLYVKVADKFHSIKKSTEITSIREKIAEKWAQDSGGALAMSEISIHRLGEHFRTTVHEVKVEQNTKIVERQMEREYKLYKYSTLLEEITRSFSLKTSGSVTSEYKIKQTLCKDFTRPFLKPKSEKKKYTSSKKQPISGTMLENFNYKQITRVSLSMEEEEDDLLEEIRNKFPEESAKNNMNFTATVGIICPLAIKYGYIQIAYSKVKKLPKLIFRYDENVQDKNHSGIELFKFSPPNQIYAKTWKLMQLLNVFPKSYLMKQTAVELLFADGKNILLNFTNLSDRMEFLIEIKKIKKGLQNLKLSSPKTLIKSTPLSSYKAKIFADASITEKWLNWQISNFEYILYLNYCAGRSYNDLTQYPVLPWVISDYTSRSCPTSLRDLSKNMGSLGSADRTEIFAERFHNMTCEGTELPFHFGSHYSNPAIALFYLMRLSPYDEGAKELQGGKFDLPDRLFNSVLDSYTSAIEDIADVREVTPEFFSLPEMLRNINALELGASQSGEVVSDVKLPPWARDSYDFVRVNREALESEAASSTLNRWIDMIFGYKQQGFEAEKAMNVFFYLTYENNVDVEKITDPQLANTISTQIFHFGRTPTQLFGKPHPQRKPLGKIIDINNVITISAPLKIYFSALTKLKPNSPIMARAIMKIKILHNREVYCIRSNRSVTKYLFAKTVNENGLYFSLDPVQNFNSPKDGLIDSEDSSIYSYSPPFQFFQGCKSLALGGYWDGRIQLRRFSTSECLNLKFFHSSTVTALEISEDEKLAITGSRDGECVVWTIEDGVWTCKHSFAHHEDEITCISISEDIHSFATTSLDGKCNIYSISSCKLNKQIAMPENKPITFVRFSLSAPCKLLLYSHEDRCIYSYSVNGDILRSVQEYSNVTTMTLVRYVTGEDFVMCGGEKGEIWIRHAGTLEKVNNSSLGVASPVTSLEMTSDFKHIIVGCADGELAILTN